MRFRPAFAFLTLAALSGGMAVAQTPAQEAPPINPPAPHRLPGVPETIPLTKIGEGAGGYHRIGLPGSKDHPFPYTVEVPTGWTVKDSQEMPGLWLGPADAKPPQDPRLIYVRASPAKLDDPEKVAATIRANAQAQANKAKDDSFSAPLIEVKDLDGVKGVLVRLDSGSGDKARSTLILKLPFESGGIDFVAGAPRAEFEKLLPVYQRVLLSVRRRAS
jgi:hypothetical protein